MRDLCLLGRVLMDALHEVDEDHRVTLTRNPLRGRRPVSQYFAVREALTSHAEACDVCWAKGRGSP